MTDNQQKYLNYKEQFKRLNRAIANGFNLEAMFIAYSIMEDRSESVLKHSGKYDMYIKSLKGHQEALHSKVKYIQKTAECKKNLLHRYFSDELLDNILDWKDERNRMVHALLKQELTSEELENLALQGKEYARLFSNRATNYRRALERAKNKD